MRIWILKASEPTLWDHQHHGTRKGRYSMLCEALYRAGHESVWWTDDFQHFNKAGGHRFGSDHCEEVAPGCQVQWIHTPGYSRNMSPRRFHDHQIMARRVEALAETFPPPDLVLSGMPSEALCVSAVRLGQRFAVPSVLDVRDLWPDVFYHCVSAVARPLIWAVTRPMVRRIRWAAANATAIVGNSSGFVDWGLRYARRQRTSLDADFPIGSTPVPPLPEISADALGAWASRGVVPGDDTFKICFLGALSSMYDFAPVVEAADRLRAASIRVQFVLCGNGPLLDSMREQVARRGLGEQILLPGRVPIDQAHALIRISHLGLACYVDVFNFRMNLTNKPGEYLSGHLPILCSVEGILSDLLRTHGCGVTYHDAGELMEAILGYQTSRERLKTQQDNARRLFENKFDADTIYDAYVAHLERIVQAESAEGRRRTPGRG